MKEFKAYHPLVNFIYFVAVIGFSMVFLHPAYLVVSFGASFIYSIMLKGVKALKLNLLFVFGAIFLTAILNPLFNHQGITQIAPLPDGNFITYEALFYGLCSGITIACVICWFLCYNEIMTSDKFIYLFGKIVPSMSLVISMTLRFIPRFINRMRQMWDIQKISSSKKNKLSRAVSVMWATVTWALENGVDTSDSMRARGYGLPKRSAFSIFRFTPRDWWVLVATLVLSGYIIVGYIFDAMYFNFYPMIIYNSASVYSVSVAAAYFILCFMPVSLELWEVRKWKRLISKI